MKNVIRSKRYITVLLSILCIIVCMLGWFNHVPAYADEVENSVLEDFAGTDFDISEYPLEEDNYNLEVVQIAESANKELFVYVYQPFGDWSSFYATEIRLSTGINDNISYKDYKLDFVGVDESIGKYKVKDFVVLPDALRYYAIACIFRKWQSFVDKPLDNDNTITQMPFAVSQLWTASTVNGEVSYTLTVLDTIVVTNHRAGLYEYSTSTVLGGDYIVTEDYSIAFSTDIKMEKVFEADVSYWVETDLSDDWRNPDIKWVEHFVTCYSDHTSSAQNGYYLWADTYTWSDIETVESYINRVKLTDNVKTQIKDMDWVLHYYKRDVLANDLTHKYAGPLNIRDTSILRLKYMVDGKTYNVGVVDYKTTGISEPDNAYDDPFVWLESAIEWIKKNWAWLVIGVIAIIVIIIFAPFLPSILSFVVQLFVWLIKGLLWLITLPFRLVIGLFSGGSK